MILEFKGKTPEIHESSYVAPNSTLIGNLTIAEKCMVLFGAVVRADMNSVSIGPKCCIQENAVVHAANDKIVFEGESIVGYNCAVHGGKIGKNAFIGAGSVLLQGVKIGKESIIAAGSVLPMNMEVPPRSLVAGVPAKVVRELGTTDIMGLNKMAVQGYQMLLREYKKEGNLREVEL
ncbi:MAG: gamma carbonic anhydrase family protein [Halobacteriota archaeon]|nr:gamma carbonic anhydrase family protein [Halobacteriota archaeon]